MSEPWNFTLSSGQIVGLAVKFSVGLLVVSAFLAIRWTLSTLRPKDYPPGPPVIPGIGNLHQIPIQKPYLQFQKWAKKYGPMVGLKTGAGNLVLLSKPELIHELFDKRGAICSNRPVSHVLTKHVFSEPEEKQITILQYDDYYRRFRKALQTVLGPAGLKRMLPLVEAEASNLCRKLLLDGGGERYEDHLRYWSLAVPLVVTSGERLDDLPPGYADDFYHSQEIALELIVPGAAPLVDIFPALKYVPAFLASWKRKARVVRGYILQDAANFLEGGRRQFRQLVQNPASVRLESLLARILKGQEMEKQNQHSAKTDEHFTDTELGFLGQALVGAAVDTTSATFRSLMVAFAACPHVLAKAQQEVDRVVGTGAPPTTDHLGDLVYLRACVSEILRWRPTTPSALPHVLTEDQRVGGYFLPKGTTLIADAWTVHHNAAEYERPDEFIPERFLENPYGLRRELYSEKGVDEAAGSRRALYAFGSGRRQCPGEQFAFTAVVLTAAKMVWAYDVLPPAGGVDVSIETGFQDGVVLQPSNPNVLFRIRGEGRKEGLLNDALRTDVVARGLLGWT